MKWIDTIVTLTAIAIFVLAMRSCGGIGPSVVIRERIDTVTISVPVIEYRDVPGRTRVQYDTLHDTTAINALLSDVDSLQRTISRMGARRLFTLDTVTQRGDSVFVGCDETNRQITLRVRPAPVDTVIRRVDTLMIDPRGKQPIIVKYAQGAVALNAAGVTTAQANVGIRLNITDNTAPFIDAGWNIINGPLLRIGLEITF